MVYQGSCHCKAIRFEFDSPPITTALQCNCSICLRKNAIMSSEYIDAEEFNLLSGKQGLSCYRWGDKDVNHYFCKACGIYCFHDSTYKPGNYRINLGCVEGLDPRQLEIKYFDGKRLL